MCPENHTRSRVAPQPAKTVRLTACNLVQSVGGVRRTGQHTAPDEEAVDQCDARRRSSQTDHPDGPLAAVRTGAKGPKFSWEEWPTFLGRPDRFLSKKLFLLGKKVIRPWEESSVAWKARTRSSNRRLGAGQTGGRGVRLRRASPPICYNPGEGLQPVSQTRLWPLTILPHTKARRHEGNDGDFCALGGSV